ncbi:MAG: DUF2183 domain-containing protein [Desulfobacterales bacterium]|nr:DUF2183 domain-containing protein [Desulfobacterales bacterium]
MEKFILRSMATVMSRKSKGGTISPDSLAIIPFSGYATNAIFHFRGRVVEKSGVVRMDHHDTFIDNAQKMWKRFFIRPGSDVTVRVRFGSMHRMVNTTIQGFFRADLELNLPLCTSTRRSVKVEVVSPRPQTPVQAMGQVFFPPLGARIGIISDIDDTIMYAHAANPFKMISLLMFSNASTRQPFPGVRPFYRALHGGLSGCEQNPFFYISSSSWQMYDILQDFMDIHGLPPGPIFLRELPFTGSMKDPWRHGYKLKRIHEILESYPGLPFLLLGDSGQRDVEIYSLISRSFPGRIPVLYIRDVLPCALRRSRIAEIASKVKNYGSELVLLNDTMAAAKHAAIRGWIPVERLSEIENDRVEMEYPERSFDGGKTSVPSAAYPEERRYS